MRKQATWMRGWDDRILSYTLDQGSSHATEMANNRHIHLSEQRVAKRLKILSANGLVDRLGTGAYQITEKGEKYLSGEYDAERDALVRAVRFEVVVTTTGQGNSITHSEVHSPDEFFPELHPELGLEKVNEVANSINPDVFASGKTIAKVIVDTEDGCSIEWTVSVM